MKMTPIDHSIGGWKLEVEENSIEKTIVAGDGRIICEIKEGDTPRKVWGNASLLAYAEAMYNVLRAVRPYILSGEALLVDKLLDKIEGRD